MITAVVGQLGKRVAGSAGERVAEQIGDNLADFFSEGASIFFFGLPEHCKKKTNSIISFLSGHLFCKF